MQLLKQKHEEASCNRFLNIYNKQSDNKVIFVRLGNPIANEPDCVCRNGVAIELVGVYDNPYQAEKISSTPRGKNVFQKPNIQFLTLENLVPEIGKKLYKLEAGNYDGFSGKIILLCNLHSPLLTDQEAEQYTKSYVPFRRDNHFDRYFDEIWITWKSDKGGDWKIQKLE